MDIPEAVNQRIHTIIVKMTSNDLHNNTQKTRAPQWPKEKGQKDKQHAHISTDRVTRTPQIIASCPFFHDIVYIKKMKILK
jgi:hypothetical protein